MVKRSWEKKTDNKGFTLVELIVVLVILAILAAILVPALLGYIDRERGSQILLNGKSVLTAAQAEASNAYGTAKSDETIAAKLDDNTCKQIGMTADTPKGSGAYFTTGVANAGASSSNHAAWTIKFVAYWEGDSGVFFDGSSWVEGLKASDAQTMFTDAIKDIDGCGYGIYNRTGDAGTIADFTATGYSGDKTITTTP